MKPVQPYASHPIVARAKAIILQPRAEWPVIDAEPASIGGIMKSYVLPLAAIPPVCGAIGSLVFGYSAFGITFRPSVAAVILAAVVLTLLIGVPSAPIVRMFAPTQAYAASDFALRHPDA